MVASIIMSVRTSTACIMAHTPVCACTYIQHWSDWYHPNVLLVDYQIWDTLSWNWCWRLIYIRRDNFVYATLDVDVCTLSVTYIRSLSVSSTSNHSIRSLLELTTWQDDLTTADIIDSRIFANDCTIISTDLTVKEYTPQLHHNTLTFNDSRLRSWAFSLTFNVATATDWYRNWLSCRVTFVPCR